MSGGQQILQGIQKLQKSNESILKEVQALRDDVTNMKENITNLNVAITTLESSVTDVKTGIQMNNFNAKVPHTGAKASSPAKSNVSGKSFPSFPYQWLIGEYSKDAENVKSVYLSESQIEEFNSVMANSNIVQAAQGANRIKEEYKILWQEYVKADVEVRKKVMNDFDNARSKFNQNQLTPAVKEN